jgi:hypothetical protein
MLVGFKFRVAALVLSAAGTGCRAAAAVGLALAPVCASTVMCMSRRHVPPLTPVTVVPYLALRMSCHASDRPMAASSVSVCMRVCVYVYVYAYAQVYPFVYSQCIFFVVNDSMYVRPACRP